MSEHELRRTWLRRSLVVAGGATTLMRVPGLVGQDKAKKAGSKGGEDEDVSPAEDLMREHGVLERVLLIYREIMRRIDQQTGLLTRPSNVVCRADSLLRRGLPRETRRRYLFPRFRKANRLVDLDGNLVPAAPEGSGANGKNVRLVTAKREGPRPAWQVKRRLYQLSA